jgi:hypothetical protein
MAAFQALISAYMASVTAKASRATADVRAYKAARAALEAALGLLGAYVNSVAQGDASVVLKSGFPSYETARPRATVPPAAPGDVRLRHGPLGGSIVIRCRPARQRGANQIQTKTGDPNDESGWNDAGVFSGGRTTLTGLPVGAVLWVRLRTSGLNGVMGDWSDPVRIVVI